VFALDRSRSLQASTTGSDGARHFGTRRLVRASLLVLALTLIGALALACESQSETEDEEKSVERQDPDPERTIHVELLYPPEEGYKNAHYRIEFRPGEGYDFPDKLLDPMLAAATEDLIPSDGMKSCRPSDSRPRWKVRIPREKGGELLLTSSSGCQHYAPWNVVKDGKLYVQLSGAFGEAFQNALVELDTPRFENARWPRKARFELTENHGEIPDGAEAQTPPWASMKDELVEHSDFAKHFGEEAAEVDEFELLCSQSVSEACTTLIAEATVDWRGHELRLRATANKDEIASIDMPKEMTDFDAFLDSKLFGSIEKSAGDKPITVAYDKRGDCRSLGYGAPHYKPDTDVESLNCEVYTAEVKYYDGAESLPPRVLYFPALEAARLTNWADKTDEAFYERLDARDKIMEAILLDRVWFFSTLDGELAEIEK